MKLFCLASMVGMMFLASCTTEEVHERDNKILYTTKATSNRSLLFYLSNDDIKWGGSEVGMEPRISGKPAKMLYERGKAVNSYLLRGLDDKDKFAAAHVLLTNINLGKYFPIEDSKWNRLKVKLTGNGGATYEYTQMPNLKAYWKKALKLKATEAAFKKTQ